MSAGDQYDMVCREVKYYRRHAFKIRGEAESDIKVEVSINFLYIWQGFSQKKN